MHGDQLRATNIVEVPHRRGVHTARGRAAPAPGRAVAHPGLRPLVAAVGEGRAARMSAASASTSTSNASSLRSPAVTSARAPSLRAHKLVEDDGEEEVDDEEAAEDGDGDEVDPRGVRVRVHDVEHRVGPRVEGHRLQDGYHRARDRVEGDGAAVGVLLKVVARVAVGGADAGVGVAERARSNSASSCELTTSARAPLEQAARDARRARRRAPRRRRAREGAAGGGVGAGGEGLDARVAQR